jgi:hypothetical protein
METELTIMKKQGDKEPQSYPDSMEKTGGSERDGLFTVMKATECQSCLFEGHELHRQDIKLLCLLSVIHPGSIAWFQYPESDDNTLMLGN